MSSLLKSIPFSPIATFSPTPVSSFFSILILSSMFSALITPLLSSRRFSFDTLTLIISLKLASMKILAMPCSIFVNEFFFEFEVSSVSF